MVQDEVSASSGWRHSNKCACFCKTQFPDGNYFWLVNLDVWQNLMACTAASFFTPIPAEPETESGISTMGVEPMFLWHQEWFSAHYYCALTWQICLFKVHDRVWHKFAIDSDLVGSSVVLNLHLKNQQEQDYVLSRHSPYINKQFTWMLLDKSFTLTYQMNHGVALFIS